MRITHIGSVLFEDPPWVLVRVYTDTGLVEVGEAYHGAGVHQIAVDRRMTAALLGRDPRNVERLARDMGTAMSASGFFQGAVMSAISGLEMALWDLAGQAAGVLIWQLFGGRVRERVPLYATGHNRTEETRHAYAARAVELQECGLRGIKISVHPRASDVTPLELSQAVQASLEADTWLAVDAHGAYSGPDAARLAASLADLGLQWLENPLPPQNIDAMRALTHTSPIPVGTGIRIYSQHAAARVEPAALSIDGVEPEGRFQIQVRDLVREMGDGYSSDLWSAGHGSPLRTEVVPTAMRIAYG